MNRIYRSVWNEISRTFVAAAECVKSQGKSAGSVCADGAVVTARPAGRTLARHRPLPLALEQRFMFDGAAVAPVADAAAAAAAAEAHTLVANAVAAVPAAVEVRAADPVKDGGKTEVVFVDTSVADYKTLEAGIRDGVAIVEIDGSKDGLAQIAKWAESHSGYDSISILGHGSEATLNLGTTALTSASLASTTVQAELAEIGQSLTTDGDLMLYGCDVARGVSGEKFIADLAAVTGADVAASSDATGALAKGGDWVLEKQTGTVEASVSVDDVSAYSGLLSTQTINLSGAVTSGSLSSGVFTIGGLVAFKVTSSGSFSVTQSGGWLCIEETSAASDFQIEISDPSANSEFHFISLGVNNLSSGGEPGYGAQLSLGVANAVTSATSSVIAGMNTIDLGSYGIVSTKAVLADLEQNGYQETLKVWLKDLVVDLGATIPAVTSITRSNPTSATTNADSLTWQVTFSEDVKNVNAADFAISGSTATITNVTAVSATVYNVTASGGDLANLEGSVYLSFAGAQDIAGMTGTKLITTSPTGADQHSYDISNSTLPSLTATAATPTYTENASAVSLFSAVTATTNDTGQTFSGMELTVSNVSDGSSELLNVGGSEIALTDGNTGTFSGGSYAVSVTDDVATVTLSGMTLSNAAMGSLIGGVTYRDSSEAPTAGDRVITIASVRDSGAAKSTIATSIAATVGVVAINDAPTLSATGGAPTYTENGAAVDLFSNVSIGMVEAGQSIDRLTLTVSGLADGVNEILSADGSSIVLTDGSNGTTSTNGMSYSVSLVGDTAMVTFTKTGGISTAAAQTLVDGLGYRNASEAPTTTPRVVTLTDLRDTGGTSNGGVETTALAIASTVSIAAVNDAPQLDAAPSASFTVLANTGAPVGAVGALVSSLTTGVSDVDAGALKGVAITAADATNGTWYFSTDGGANWSAIGAVSNSSALLLAADARVYFKPASGWSGDENLSFRAWDQTSGSAGSKADASSNGGATAFSTATDTAACHVPGLPAITSAAYDAATGVLTVTGTDLVALAGTNNDIVANRLTLTGEGGATYTLSDTANVDIASATSFTLTLSATDKAAINRMVNKNGTTSTSGTTFNLAAAEDWAAGADAAAAIVDLTGNGVTVSNVAVPTISSASYDAASGTLVVTGSGFSSLSGATNDIVANKLTLSGEGGTTYTLTDTADVDIASGTAFSLTLSAADRAAVNRIINRNGASSTGATAFNLAAGEDWAAGAAAAVVVADLSGNAVTASNVAVPTITGATYDATSGMLIVTGSGFTDRSGAGNDIIANKLTLTGEGGATYTLTNTANAEITSGTSFILMLSATDRAAVSQILNKNGAASTGGTAFNLAAAEDWAAGADDVVVVADLTGNAIAVANVAVPTITSATYDSSSGTLVVTGTGLTVRAGANNDIVANKLTLTGEGGATYTLTDTANVDIASATGFTLSLSAADQGQIALLINKTGTASSGGTTYNLAAAEDWAAGAEPAMVIADLSGNAVTAGILPRVTGVSSSTADGAYKAGDVISIAVNFNQNVAVTGTPSLLLETGTIDRVVNYTSGSGTSTLTFSYTVQAGDTAADLDYLGTNALALNGGSIAANDGTATNAILTLAAPGAANSLGAAKAIVIDTSVPTNTIANTHFSADSGTSSTDFVTRTAAQTISGTLGSALASGEHVEVSLDNGLNWVAATASVGTNSWSFAGATLTSSNTLQVRVADSAGNLGAAISQAYVLDSAAPAAPATPVLAAVSDSGSSSADRITKVTTPMISGTAENGATVTLYDTDGTTVLGNATADGSGNWTITSSALGSGTHTLTAKASDAAGNVSAISSGLSLTIDTSAPTATIALSDTSLAADETSPVTITFSEAVSGFSDANLTVANGTLSGLSSSDGGITWTAAFTPTANVSDTSNVITLNYSGVQDGAGNSGSGSATSANYAVLTARTLSYSATTLAEAAANDGSITSTLTVTLANATFSGADGSALGTVSNVPAGLTAHLTRTDATHATLSLTGNASAHANAQDISNLTVSFADADFAGSTAASVVGATTTLAIDFADPAALPVPPVNVVTPPVVIVTPATPATLPASAAPDPVGETVQFIASVSPLAPVVNPVAEPSLANPVAPQVVAPAPVEAPRAPTASASVADGGRQTPVPSQGGGFQLAVASRAVSPADGLVVNRGVADQSLASGSASQFAIPADAFAAGSANAVVTLFARQSDGRPLPGWLRFDAASGKFDGQPPPGFAGEVTIRVTARDAQGHEAVITFKVKVGRASGGDGQRAQPERSGRAGLAEQLRLAARPHPALERLAKATALRHAA